MRLVRYNVAASLDGYVAGPHGGFDWIPDDPTVDFAGIFAKVDTVLLGRKSYEVALEGRSDRGHHRARTAGCRNALARAESAADPAHADRHPSVPQRPGRPHVRGREMSSPVTVGRIQSPLGQPVHPAVWSTSNYPHCPQGGVDKVCSWE